MLETPGNNQLIRHDPDQLAEAGIQVLALDFDGVLAPHAADQPLQEVITWLQQASEVFGRDKIFILSNRPFGPRIDWFNQHFNGIRFISSVRKKPYPDGILRISELSSVPPDKILMVDDRLLTGSLSALLAGARVCYIRNPYQNFRQHPISETFFTSLRKLERVLVS